MQNIRELETRLVIDGLITNLDLEEMLGISKQTADKIAKKSGAKKVCNGKYIIPLEDFKNYLREEVSE